jgi:hypothetical protein
VSTRATGFFYSNCNYRMHTCQGHVWASIAHLKYSLSESNKKNGAEYTISYIYTLPRASWPPAGLHNVHFLLAPPSATMGAKVTTRDARVLKYYYLLLTCGAR